MNFLSPYYYTQANQNPYYTLGAVLPDLFRNYHPAWKFHEIDGVPARRDSSWLLKCCVSHSAVHRIVHGGPPCAAHPSQLRKNLGDLFTEPPKRPCSLAHVGYELIRHALLKQDKKVNTAKFD